jgi:squalene-hopene/tetraprenyl-beta-curcumene cyclase
MSSTAPAIAPVALARKNDPVTDGLPQAIHRTTRWLIERQAADGHWVGELEGDTILESEFLLLLAFLGREDSPLARRCARYLIRQQLADGGWAMYPGGELDISGSIKAYFALKLVGHSPHEEYMHRARRAILAHGGADRVNSFTRYYLALLGQIPYSLCPAVPPEFVLLPSWSPVNIYRISAWSRTIFVPLSIVWANKPVRPIEPQRGIRELFIRRPEDWPALSCPGQAENRGRWSWERTFRALDRWIKRCEDWRLLPLRHRAVDAAKKWMLDRFDGSDGLGAIFPPIIWSVIALKSLGYADDSREIEYNLKQLDDLVLGDGDSARLQPCKSPVWDTAITIRALAASGSTPSDEHLRRGLTWLLDREIPTPGDWTETTNAKPGGWCFEYANRFYPDVDDTAMVLMALREPFQFHSLWEANPGNVWEANPFADGQTPSLFDAGAATNMHDAKHRAALVDRVAAASKRAEKWLLAMQNRDGGWGAFDRDNDAEFLCKVPFADHNAMIDPSTPDLTARVLEALGSIGRRVGDRAVDRAVEYLRRTQEPDGSWYGRWGVNYIYGTWQTLVGLRAVGVSVDDPMVIGGAAWLVAHQQPDGGWGESPDSYANSRLRGQGLATASQTAWAILGLLAAGEPRHPATHRGVRYLLDTQRGDGGWDEKQFTGTGFPLVFYLRYHYYPIYFPLLALSLYARATSPTPNP